MDTVFSLKELDEFSEKINMDELYEKKRMKNEMELNIFNRLLNRIHNKIKLTSRQKSDEQYIFYVVPEVMIGLPKYNHSSCVSYLMYKLQENGFNVQYINPNVLFVSWKHWVPKYVTKEIKKKTGTSYDSFGNIIDKDANSNETDNESNKLIDGLMINKPGKDKVKKETKDYRSIDTYEPTGNLIYNNDLFKKIHSKLS
jgi:hypothetical protein